MFFERCSTMFFASVLLLGVASCSPRKEEKGKSMPPALVVTTAAQVQDVPVELRTFGTMEASESVTIKPMVSGELVQVGFAEGQEVERRADERSVAICLRRGTAMPAGKLTHSALLA